jgi:ferredoxin
MSSKTRDSGGGSNVELRVNPIDCHARGICAELLPEIVTPDEWGYPIITDRTIPPELLKLARRAAAACPTLAIKLAKTPRS